MLSIILIVIVCLIIYLFIKKTGFFKSFSFKKINLKEQEQKINEISGLMAESIIKKDDNDSNDLDTDDIESYFKSSENTNNSASSAEKQLAYLDVSINNNRGRIILELRNDIAPKTCKNFISLCSNKKYVNTRFHRVIKDFMIQGGDIENNDGTGGSSIYGKTFKDENFKLKHNRGTLSMANGGPNTNGSQFFISTVKTDWLDGKHTVFGKVVKGMDIVDYISGVQVNEKKLPLEDIVIVDCGLM